MSALRSVIRGVGSYLPERILTNADLAAMVETSDDWIRERTGISQRHIAAEGETTADLGYRAALAALEHAGMKAEAIDLIILATATPNQTFPATATTIQAKLGITHGAAFDVQAVCSGFIYAMTLADSLIQTKQFRTALVIGAETFSRILDWSDRGTCVLFGDGAGAVVLSGIAQEEANGRGILASEIRSDGRHNDLLYVDGGPSTTRTVGHLRMSGNQVFRHAVTNIAEAITTTLGKAGAGIADVDWFVPHQANQRILDGVARKLGIAHDRVVSTVGLHGNTSAASVPLALDVAIRDGRVQPGDLVLAEAMGGGFTWGAVLWRM